MPLLIISLAALFYLLARMFPLTALAFVLAACVANDAAINGWAFVVAMAFVADVACALFRPRCR